MTYPKAISAFGSAKPSEPPAPEWAECAFLAEMSVRQVEFEAKPEACLDLQHFVATVGLLCGCSCDGLLVQQPHAVDAVADEGGVHARQRACVGDAVPRRVLGGAERPGVRVQRRRGRRAGRAGNPGLWTLRVARVASRSALAR